MIAALVAVPPVQAANSPPVPEVLTGGPWNMNYAEDSCRLARSFGEGKAQVQIMLEFFRPGGGYQLTLAGERFATQDLRPKVKLWWGPGLGEPVEFEMNSGKVDKTIPMLLGSGLPVDNGQSQLIEHLSSAHAPTPAQEAAAREFSVEFKKKRTLLRIGEMRSPLTAARTCLDQLVTRWGLDPAEQRSILVPPAPANNPGNWAVSNDYPRQPLFKGQQAIVHFRVIVSVDGNPESCAVQSATQPAAFGETSCTLVMKRAKFRPARNEAGQPVRSFYINSIRWYVP